MHGNITRIKYDGFTVHKYKNANSFVYADFDNEDLLIRGLAEYFFSEECLLNYANSLSKIKFTPSKKIYKKLYDLIGMFLNEKLESLVFDNTTDEIKDVLGQEYSFINSNGKILIQYDKIGKIGEYIFHYILANYFKVNCIIPKFRCTTDRNMSVFGIDTLFYDTNNNMIFFGESKVCKNIDNAIKLVNHSLLEYESQISEEYRLVLSNDDTYNLSEEFLEVFQEHTEICMNFQDFIKSANIKKICVPVFLAHGKTKNNDIIDEYLNKMINKINTKSFFGLETCYLFISLPIIDKNKAMNEIMRKVVEKSNEFETKYREI